MPRCESCDYCEPETRVQCMAGCWHDVCHRCAALMAEADRRALAAMVQSQKRFETAWLN